MFPVRTVKALKKKGTIMSVLEIKDLHVEIEGKEILKGVNLTLKQGKLQLSWDQMVPVSLLFQLLLWGTQTMKSLKVKSCLTV